MRRYRFPYVWPRNKDGRCRWCNDPVAGGRRRFVWEREFHAECRRHYEVAFVPHERLRFVWERDRGRCAQCGDVASRWHADHIKPLWQQPIDIALSDRASWFGLDNLQTLCVRCHNDKSAQEAAFLSRFRRKHGGRAVQSLLLGMPANQQEAA